MTRRSLLWRPKTLKYFILVAAFLVSVLLFSLTYFAVSSIYHQRIGEEASRLSELVAQHTFSSMYQIMSRGWTRTDLEAFLASVRKTSRDSNYRLDIYRGEVVEAAFGRIEQPALDDELHKVFASGAITRQQQDMVLRTLYPLVANEECLRCHTNASSGDVLGVIDMRHDLAPMMARADEDFVSALLLITPIPLLAALVVALFVIRRITRPLTQLRNHIATINSLSDLKSLQSEMPSLGFQELNGLRDSISELVDQLREIAVDKDLLEFEIRLLERFVITSDVVRDWQDYVKHLLLEINKVIPSYTLFSMFKVGDEALDLEIFWVAQPSEQSMAQFERNVRRMITQTERFGGDLVDNIHHHVADSGAGPLDLDMLNVDLQSKSLVVETPKIGGIVGVGLHASPDVDPTRTLVVDSILSTLLNVVGSVKAISKYTRELEYYATRDPLTNLYNQRVFRELLEYEIGRAGRHQHRFALLVIDLDNFKQINDTHGHQEGDYFLQQFADSVKSVLRTGDVFARYGGDEFVVMLTEVENDDDPYISARRVLATAESVVRHSAHGDEIQATASIGVAIYPDHADNGSDLFLFADHMMYKAKAEGKNRLAVPGQEDVLESFRLISEKTSLVQQAIDERWLKPYFQPIVHSSDNAPFAYEVLSRIQLPSGEIVSAGEFIEVAERAGLIHTMDMMVIEQAFDLIGRIGYQQSLFINLSPKALVLNEFFEKINQLAKQYQVNPNNIVFELTERDTVRNIGLLEQFVTRLHMEGFKFAIDDFGSGFSSFHYLKRFPVDYVKIEGEFISNMIRDERDTAFVQSIAMLAHELGMRTIGEFVEDEDVRQAVINAGIDYAQGYHVGRPQPHIDVV